MAASLTHLSSQQELDQYLNRRHRLPVEISSESPLPHNKKYKPLRTLTKTGLKFSLRELLHIVGSKTAALPFSAEDHCLKTAYALLMTLDLRQKHLAFRADIPSDFQTPRSQEMGVGVSCLIANKHLQMPIDALEPIPKVGKRFDYQGRRDGLSCMLEAKGTKYLYNQLRQIQDGLEKKKAHHAEGQHYDVELISSVCVGVGRQKPRILLADPPTAFGEWLRSEQARKFFRLRHYARVMQFVGATELARGLYAESNELKDFGMQRLDRIRNYSTFPMPETRMTVEQEEYVGTYYNSPFPATGHRYSHVRRRDIRTEPFDHRIRTFQGLRMDVFTAIRMGNAEEQSLQTRRVARNSTGSIASIFEDGSVFLVELQR